MIEIFSIFSYNSVAIYVAKVKKLILATKILKKGFLMLTQKDIDNLEIKDKRYMISVGEPKELYVRVNPTGKKVFYLRASKFKNFITIGECQKGV
ncbi:Arm DNA-binding domain-containing protein [Campylobacter jejuni]|nr:Arm DNA-binding domain-containing protein [Campylobacter sp. BCW_6460]